MNAKIKHLGYSLLELLITLSLIAVLSLLGNASYRHFIERANRLAAEHTLMSAAATLERYALTHGSYEGARLNLPEHAQAGYRYHATVSATTYTLTADPLENNHDTSGRISLDERFAS